MLNWCKNRNSPGTFHMASEPTKVNPVDFMLQYREGMATNRSCLWINREGMAKEGLVWGPRQLAVKSGLRTQGEGVAKTRSGLWIQRINWLQRGLVCCFTDLSGCKEVWFVVSEN